MTEMKPSLEPDYTLEEVAEAMKMSTRWVRDRVNLDGADHRRYGHKIRFSEAQFEALKKMHDVERAEESITTGKKRSR